MFPLSDSPTFLLYDSCTQFALLLFIDQLITNGYHSLFLVAPYVAEIRVGSHRWTEDSIMCSFFPSYFV
jgi:hypothetical protein